MKRKLIYWLIEITYLLISVVLLINLNDRYFSYHSSDIYYFICFGIIILVLLLLFEPVKNKIIIFLFDFLFFNYIITQSENLEITGEAIRISDFNLKLYFNDVSIIILLITTMIFIALWYYFQREVVNYSKYQILSITLLVFIPFLYHLNYNAILEDAKAYGYQLNETDYYDYLHFNNSNIFIEKFGISNYLVEDISQAFTIDIKREKAIKSIDKFLENKKIPIENRHSGIFKGKNVLIIQADGFIDAFVSKELTPNIYKLKSEGINITEFYSPCINEKQGNTEIMANFSIIPSYNDYGLYKYDNNEYITTLAATFNKSDYYSYYYHNDYSIYYNKDIIVPKYQFN